MEQENPKNKLTKNSRGNYIKNNLQMRNKKGTKGITLIALVITIIVLLILAGVSIATLTGENGILTKANEAKDKTNIANVKEMAQTDILGYQAENESEEITIGQLKDVLSKYFKDVPDEEQLKEKLKDTDYSLKVKEEYGGDSIEVRVSDIYAAKLEELAKDVLKVNPDATNDYEKSPYVKYNGILCRVFYNDTEHGLQIISSNNMSEEVTLGSNDFGEAKEAYNDVVNTLNKKAKEYMLETDKTDENKIAIDARSLGSIAKLKGGKFQEDPITETEYENEYPYFSDYNKQFKVEDNNYKEDADNSNGQLQKLGLNATNTTWLASRGMDEDSSFTDFGVRSVKSNGYVYSDGLVLGNVLCLVISGGGTGSGGRTYGFRPVFLLSSKVKIKSGDGTSDTPYELEI